MKMEYTKIASIPQDEEIVSMIQNGGYFYWDFKYPFRHYKEATYLIATKKAIYEIKFMKLN